MSHTCHAHGCPTPVPPRMFTCGFHWRRLDRRLQAAVWREYRSGQEIDKRPSLRYLAVQSRAVGFLAFKRNNEPAARAAAPYLIQAEIYRAQCVAADLGDPLAGLPGGPAAPLLVSPEDIEKARAAIVAIRAEAQALGEG